MFHRKIRRRERYHRCRMNCITSRLVHSVLVIPTTTTPRVLQADPGPRLERICVLQLDAVLRSARERHGALPAAELARSARALWQSHRGRCPDPPHGTANAAGGPAGDSSTRVPRTPAPEVPPPLVAAAHAAQRPRPRPHLHAGPSTRMRAHKRTAPPAALRR